jgi:hypothetical protein
MQPERSLPNRTKGQTEAVIIQPSALSPLNTLSFRTALAVRNLLLVLEEADSSWLKPFGMTMF